MTEEIKEVEVEETKAEKPKRKAKAEPVKESVEYRHGLPVRKR